MNPLKGTNTKAGDAGKESVSPLPPVPAQPPGQVVAPAPTPIPVPAPPPSRAVPRSGRRPSSGVAAILLIDVFALLLVAASGPVAYRWLDQSHLRQLPASAPANGPSGATPALSYSPGSGSAEPGASSTAGSSGTASPGSSPTFAYGNGTWIRTGPLPQAVWAAASVLMSDGRVMVLGGSSGPSSQEAVATAAIFDPATGRWTVVTPMLQPRTYAMAVTLADGSVLVAGGSRNGQPLDTAERYYPETGTWVAAGRLNLPRTQGTLTVLGDGRVLATGGGIESGPAYTATASAEIYDSVGGGWSLTAPMAVARARHTATLLQDGEVLVVGGATTYHGTAGSVTSTAEIYDPRSSAWRTVARMPKPRYVHAAVALSDGRVLVAGGWYSTSNSDPSHNTAVIYDPTNDRWTATPSMIRGRAQYGLASLPDGRVLAAGGIGPAYKVEATSELYDPTTGAWKSTGNLDVAAMGAAIQALPDGRVLIAGGDLDVSAAKVTAVCEIYAPAPR